MTEPGNLSCLNFRCDPFPPETWRQPAAFRSWMSSRILRGISRPNKLTPDPAIWPRRWPGHLSQLRRRVDELPRYRDQSGSGRLRPEPRLRVAKSWLSDAPNPLVLVLAPDKMRCNGNWCMTFELPNGKRMAEEGFWSAVEVKDGDTWKHQLLTFNVIPK
jgi:hypothetical protein